MSTLVISPHLDDAVLSLGARIATRSSCVVMTLFAGAPTDDAATEWDAAAGFASSSEAISERRREDARALRLLGASPLWLDLLDAQYGGDDTPEDVAAHIRPMVERIRPAEVLLPLGLFHSDHLRASDACIVLCRASRAPTRWSLYEDVPYRAMDGAVDARRADLVRQGVLFGPCRVHRAGRVARRKRAAVSQYASQVRALSTPGRPGIAEAAGDERLWPVRWRAPRAQPGSFGSTAGSSG